MGKYINDINGQPVPKNNKVDFLIKNVPGTLKLSSPPDEWEEDLVCVVKNNQFEAAAYAYDAAEMGIFRYPDGRQKTWLLVPNAKNYAK